MSDHLSGMATRASVLRHASRVVDVWLQRLQASRPLWDSWSSMADGLTAEGSVSDPGQQQLWREAQGLVYERFMHAYMKQLIAQISDGAGEAKSAIPLRERLKAAAAAARGKRPRQPRGGGRSSAAKVPAAAGSSRGRGGPARLDQGPRLEQRVIGRVG